jgi:hypothetical protein
MAVYNGSVFLVINGATNATYRYNVSDYTATLAASRALATGSSAITIDSDGTTVYASKGLNAYSLDTSLNPVVPTSTLSASAGRLAYGGGTLFYLSTAGRFARVALGVSDTTITTGGPTASNIKGLAASNDGHALYYASTSTLTKISATSGSVLWTKAVSNIAGIDVRASTGRITLINSSGAVMTYNPINPLSSASSSASGTSAILNWTAGVSDTDFSGVTIRRSTSGYPESATDGIAVTSSSMSTSFTDTELDEGTYYYSFFNQTSDGYYSSAVTSTVTIDLPPDAPTLAAEATDTSIHLSWSVPADTASFMLRRSTSEFPVSYTDGSTVTTTDVTVTSLTETGMPDGTYYYGLFAADIGGNYSAAGTASVTIDTTPPATPTLSVMASSSNILLSWDTPPPPPLPSSCVAVRSTSRRRF